MSKTIVASRYRITITKEIREKLGIRAGQKVEVTASGWGITIVPLPDDRKHDHTARRST